LRAAGQEEAALQHFLQGADCVLAVAASLPPVLARLVAALLRDAAQSVNKLEADSSELLRLIDRYNALAWPEQH
jgi:dihydrodipicolinate synthase/N-acetylneuraminate lyase